MNARGLLAGAIVASAAGCAGERPVPPDEMSEEDRAAFFLDTIRDSGFICAEVMQVQRIAQDGSSWRISCTDVTAYLATVDADGDVAVSPAPYVEPPPPQQIPPQLNRPPPRD